MLTQWKTSCESQSNMTPSSLLTFVLPKNRRHDIWVLLWKRRAEPCMSTHSCHPLWEALKESGLSGNRFVALMSPEKDFYTLINTPILGLMEMLQQLNKSLKDRKFFFPLWITLFFFLSSRNKLSSFTAMFAPQLIRTWSLLHPSLLS